MWDRGDLKKIVSFPLSATQYLFYSSMRVPTHCKSLGGSAEDISMLRSAEQGRCFTAASHAYRELKPIMIV